MAPPFWVLVLLSMIVQRFVATPFKATNTTDRASSTDEAYIFIIRSLDSVPTIKHYGAPNRLTISPLSTIAPMTANRIEQRQKCFND